MLEVHRPSYEGYVCWDCRNKGKNLYGPGGSGCVQCGRGSQGGPPDYRDTCIDCPAGKNASKTSKCQACGEGRYNVRPGEDTCYLCIEGEWGTSTGQTTCKTCATEQSDGKYTGENHQTCKTCPAGKMPGKKLEKCENCTKGYKGVSGKCEECNATAFKYADKEGQDTCGTCGAGFEPTSKREPQACRKCPAGRFNDGNMNRGRCEECPQGFYCGEGAKKAEKCADGESTWASFTDPKHWFRHWGYTIKKDCKKCPVGKFMNTSTYHWEEAQRDFEIHTCEKCQIGTYGTKEGLTECEKCGGKNTTSGTGKTKISDCHPKN